MFGQILRVSVILFARVGSGSPRSCTSVRDQCHARLLALSFVCLLPCVATAQDPAYTPDLLASQYVDSFIEHRLTSARQLQMPALVSRVQLMAPAQSDLKPTSDSSLQQLSEHELLREASSSIRTAVGAETQHIAAAVDGLSAKLTAELQRAKSEWIAVRGRRIQLETQAMEIAGSRNAAAQFATLLNARNLWLWLGAVFSAAGLIIAGWYTRRHYFRRLFWVRQNKFRFVVGSLCCLMLIVLIPALIILLTGDMAYLSLIDATISESPISKEQRLIHELADHLRAANGDQVISESEAQIKSTMGELESRPGGIILSNNRSALSESIRVLKITIDLSAQQSLLREIADETSGETAKDRQLLSLAESNLQNNAETLQQSRKRSFQAAAVLGIGLLSAFGTAGVYLLKTETSERNKRRSTCPQCCTVNSMKSVITKNGGVNLVCNAEIEDEMGISEPCGFSYDESNGDIPKLMFPTLGINATGKTHWMAMNYRQLNFGNAPAGVHFERLKSDKTEEFDEKIRLLLESRSAFEATYHTQGFVHPLMFVLQDADPLPLSRSQLIANLLDLGGIVTRERNHPLRNSALNGNGFLFFLDPTRNVEEQNEALSLFREDVRMAQKLKPHQQMQRPLAICISKIDIIGTEAYVGSLPGLADEFYRALREADTRNAPLSLALIRARHEIMNGYIQTLFPGWDILKSVESLFGPRVCFFPLTPVGLQGSGGGGFTRTSQDPYAILEPLLWLIHMNGYPILH